MSDRMWNIIWLFFASTIIIGGFTLAYFGERGQLGIIMDNPWIKYSIILFGLIGVFFIVYSEVRKRVEVESVKTVLVTILIIIIVFAFFALTRL
ncbi:hypothetical protein [Lederbergia galactosidilytica]|uniref:Uncharacterized protein n=1 Tax=Lederbergia galactosidilytica TaxID=217031 RepID=A0A0Q9XM19_9BACI|nr:hypothetical protein [Lederbergia galactosidilytica]KRG09371.1 hypothetical protein ACA29_23185 [Lederbergia galactosidilytica]KRG13180.1 hypothetical protein ACA30_16425 [Virgibacillus soli]MBP1917290.1 membrane associated rhomboid family serine protease [Lederbergia galactosidilytica]OAK69005.1 hypothetical protein ABB05_14580 [Lederbergia galactosidilytica]